MNSAPSSWVTCWTVKKRAMGVRDLLPCRHNLIKAHHCLPLTVGQRGDRALGLVEPFGQALTQEPADISNLAARFVD